MSNNHSYFVEREKNFITRTENIIAEFPDYVKRFFVAIETTTSPLTRLNYAVDIRIFFYYLLLRVYPECSSASELSLSHIESVTAFHVESFLSYLSDYITPEGNEERCSINAKKRKLSSLRKFYHYLFQRDLISVNNVSKVDTPKLHEKPIVCLSKTESSCMIQTANTGDGLSKMQAVFHEKTRVRDIAIIKLFLGTGIRVSELVGLNNDDIDYETNSFRITRKGGNEAILYFSDDVRLALADYMDEKELYLNECEKRGDKESLKLFDEQALFLTSRGKSRQRIGVRSVEELIQKYARIASPLKHITPHKLRSTFGTRLYEETGDIYAVASVLGHKDVNTTTRHYAKSSDEIRRNAILSLATSEKDEK